jgi:antibiotic biosynthesis monooxygenase (ABM) superfamily enzyme
METSMYPQTTQFETRQLTLERELHLTREIRAGRAAAARSAGERPLARPRVGPPRYKLALLTWGAAYAVITLILTVLGSAMASWPLGLRTLVLSVLMVAALTWLVMPALTRLFRGWLSPTA